VNTCLYAGDLNDAEWALRAPLVPCSHPAGRRQTYPLRRIVDAIFYLLRTGAQWRLLPHEYPPRGAVFYHYALWREDGTWEHVTQTLRDPERLVVYAREEAGMGARERSLGAAQQDHRIGLDRLRQLRLPCQPSHATAQWLVRGYLCLIPSNKRAGIRDHAFSGVSTGPSLRLRHSRQTYSQRWPAAGRLASCTRLASISERMRAAMVSTENGLVSTAIPGAR
jgi:transposase